MYVAVVKLVWFNLVSFQAILTHFVLIASQQIRHNLKKAA
jgi:hypothetical protein